MMIVASNSITVSNVNDGIAGKAGISIVSVDVEYAKNTSNTNPPTSGWTTISPKWGIGSYIWQRVKTTYSVGNPTYSQPHCIETDTVNNITYYISSRGENLVTNGTGLMKNNTNFSRMVFDGTDNYGSSGSFKYTGVAAMESDELIPVDPNETYKMSYYIKENPYVGARTYGLVSSYDPDGNLILATHTMFVANTLTELAQDLKNGDTKIYLNSTSNWINTGTAGVATYQKKLIVWDYSNSYGYTYPPETYSRRIWDNLWDPGAINHTEKSITLKVPWAGGMIAIGTKVSNGYDGGNYKYISGSNFTNPQEWTNKSGLIGGIDMSGKNISNMFFPGTSAVKVGWLLNRDVSGGTTWLTNITFNKHVASQTDLDNTNQKVNKTVKNITEEYCQSTSATSQTGDIWTTVAPTWKEGKFIFIRSKITYVDDTTSYTPIVNITGASGKDGKDGTDGTSGIIVSSVAPASPKTGQLWQDTSTTPQLVKKWNGSSWVIWELYAQNLKADSLSALSANLGDIDGGTLKLMDDNMLINGRPKMYGIYQSKLGLISSGPTFETSGSGIISDTQMGVASLNKGEMRFIVTDYTEDLKTLQESGMSDQDNAFIKFESYDNGKDVMTIGSSGDIVFKGNTSQDTPWVTISNGVKYKFMFSRVYISVNIVGNGSQYMQFGVLPQNLRPISDQFLIIANLGTATADDRHIMVRASDGAVVLWAPKSGVTYGGEVSFTL